MLYVNDENEKYLRIGWLIGFFNADGGFSISKSYSYTVFFGQKLLEPLLRVRDILNELGIESRIYQSRTGKHNLHGLYVVREDIPTFLDIVEGRLYGQKRRDLKIFRKIVVIREEDEERENWIQRHREETEKIYTEWKVNREEYRNSGEEVNLLHNLVENGG